MWSVFGRWSVFQAIVFQVSGRWAVVPMGDEVAEDGVCGFAKFSLHLCIPAGTTGPRTPAGAAPGPATRLAFGSALGSSYICQCRCLYKLKLHV